ncbi:MAG: hypothetical protein HY244_00300 [Rhizobiales bacterium]|nr:hypothetical protein [Hyphomicrobiales bacterium]
MPRRCWLIVALTVVGFGITLWVFYPGVMTYDAKYVYQDMVEGFRGDWQSPVMTSLWALIDPLAPGTASMFLLTATLYWLGFGILALATARRSIGLAILLLLLALSPPAFMFVGIIWRDVLLAGLWLLAAALCFIVAACEARLRISVQAVALALVAFGVLLRPNALIAAPVLVAYIIWPAQFRWKRTAILFVPAAVAFYGLIQVVYYGVLGATRQNIVQSIMVFDLGGISHFAKQNQFPVGWTEAENEQLLNGCYKPTEWDIYWRLPPCEFVMRKLEKEQKLFGTPAVSKAWTSAILNHPVAYLEHRLAFFWNFVAAGNLTLWVYNIEDLSKPVLDGRAGFTALAAIDRALKPTPLLRVGPWWLLCLALCAIGWRRRDTPAGAFTLGVGGSAVLYVLTFLPVGVASDFRYGYWAVLAGLSGAVAALTRRSP